MTYLPHHISPYRNTRADTSIPTMPTRTAISRRRPPWRQQRLSLRHHNLWRMRTIPLRLRLRNGQDTRSFCILWRWGLYSWRRTHRVVEPGDFGEWLCCVFFDGFEAAFTLLAAAEEEEDCEGDEDGACGRAGCDAGYGAVCLLFLGGDCWL